MLAEVVTYATMSVTMKLLARLLVFVAIIVFGYLAVAPVSAAGLKEDASTGCFLSPSNKTFLGFTTASFGKDIPSIGCLAQIVVRVINVAVILLGAIAVIFLLVASMRFITSRGDPKAIQGAQNMATYAVIGTVIVVGSFLLLRIFMWIFHLEGDTDIMKNFSFFLNG